jgi:hypothetical protein
MGSNRKMAIEKLTTRLKNKTWANPQIKNHKKSHEFKTGQTADTTQKSRTHIFEILKTANTICAENCESSSWVQKSLKTKKYKCVI